MLELEGYLERLTGIMRSRFKERLKYMGLQGSYLRGEAGENSDVDIMVVLDCISRADLEAYRLALKEAGEYERACGFICGKEDLAHWNPLEAFHISQSTKDIYGALKEYLPAYRRADIGNFVKVSVGNLYHELCHRYIHAPRQKSIDKLKNAEKSIFFILQDLHYLETGKFCETRAELQKSLEGQDERVFEMYAQNRMREDFEAVFDETLIWCQSALKRASIS